MKNIFKYPVAIGMSPNTTWRDSYEALKVMLQPWKWKNGRSIKKIENWFCRFLNSNDAVSFISGRIALWAILKSFGIGKGDEVIIQAFTCAVVSNPVIWLGAKPVYCDIDSSINLDPKNLEKIITKNTKAVIVQHTFGIAADIDNIKQVAYKNNLIVIEDCAHSLGLMIKGAKAGSFGDAAFFSFGRDKIISSVFGGIAIVNDKHRNVQKKLRENQQNVKQASYNWIFQQLFHPLSMFLILPLYSLNIGKVMLVVFQKIGLLSKPVYEEEKKSMKPGIFPARYPNALACLLTVQIPRLDSYNEMRRKHAQYYFDNFKSVKSITLPKNRKDSVYLRFNIITDNAVQILSDAKKNNILLGNWYKNIIDPKGVVYEKVFYEKGSCPIAEKMAETSINLPTYPRLKISDLARVIKIVKKV